MWADVADGGPAVTLFLMLVLSLLLYDFSINFIRAQSSSGYKYFTKTKIAYIFQRGK